MKEQRLDSPLLIPGGAAAKGSKPMVLELFEKGLFLVVDRGDMSAFQLVLFFLCLSMAFANRALDRCSPYSIPSLNVVIQCRCESVSARRGWTGGSYQRPKGGYLWSRSMLPSLTCVATKKAFLFFLFPAQLKL